MDVGGQHEWGELVLLDPQTVGVIVRLERETFQVCGTISLGRLCASVGSDSMLRIR